MFNPLILARDSPKILITIIFLTVGMVVMVLGIIMIGPKQDKD